VAGAHPARVPVTGRWLRHIPASSDPLYRAPTPADGRWQRGDVVEGIYLADQADTVWSEWYRWLAEHETEPLRALPREVWAYAASLEAADLSTPDALDALGLPPLEPSRDQWPAFQAVGESLHGEGYKGVLYSSAARPEGLCLCVFREAESGFALLEPVPPPRRVERPPAPPRGLRT
jgi:RES domain-containing protein